MAENDEKRTSLRKQIDENLKRAYEEELHREVPDRFTDLLDQLRKKEGAK
ncbi:transcriptional regulator [Thioclava sp. BHET1]|nr:transcriptional regulator [Thioclava sp. BHET1]